MHDIDELNDPQEQIKKNLKKYNFYVRAKNIVQKNFLIKYSI